MTQIARKDPMVDEGIDILNNHLHRSNNDPVKAAKTLTSVYTDFITAELGKCLLDPRYYLENYHVVKTEHQGFRTLYPFWDSQEIIYSEIMSLIKAGKPAKVLVDKARQLGSSTLSQGLIFQRTIFNETINTLIVAQDPGQADYLFSMSVLAYDNLPWWMKPEVKYQSKGRYLILDSNNPLKAGLGSSIFVDAANKMTGVSVGRTVRCAHLSELSSWNDAATLTDHIFPTMNAPDTLAILESTARGRSGFWYEFWRDCVDNWGDEGWQWKPIFVEWFRCKKYFLPIENKENFKITKEERGVRESIVKSSKFFIPDEMFNWRRNKIRETIAIKGDDSSVMQEYPNTWQESFQTSGICAFPKKRLYELLNTTCCDPRWYGEIVYNHNTVREISFTSLEKPGDLVEVYDQDGTYRRGADNQRIDVPAPKKFGTRLRVWEKPISGESYYQAADPAHGLEGRGDFSCVQIIRIGRGGSPDVQVAEWHGWINPTPFAHICVALGKWYNLCEIALELNSSVGEKTYIEMFRMLEYPNMFRWKHYDKVKNMYTNYMGWFTNHKTRDLIIANMRERIVENTIILKSKLLVDEMLDFSSEEDGGRFEGQSGKDDAVMAMQIAAWCAHDSDYGQTAATKPSNVGPESRKFYVLDELQRVIATCDDRKDAMVACFRPADPARGIAAGTLMRAGYSIMERKQRTDLYNTDFSHVHDRNGPRSRMHYEYGIPAEQISLDNVFEIDTSSQDADWRSY